MFLPLCGHRALPLAVRLLTATAITSAIAGPVWAQEVTEVVVTARKKPETLSHAPLSVAVITGEQMRGAGAYDLRDAQVLTPSLLITSTANEAQTTARLRGVGTVGDNPGLESSVGVVIDGVVRARTATAMSDLGVVERIEILKGPQTSLFGKGASAGIIQAVTQAPRFTPEQVYELTAGERGTFAATAYVSAPLADKWAGSLSLVHRQRDGQYRVTTGQGPRGETRDGDQNYDSLRGQLLYLDADRLGVRLIADYTARDENCCTGTVVQVGATAPWINSLAAGNGVATTADIDGRRAFSNRSTAQRIQDGGLSAEVNWRLDSGPTLTSLTAVRRFDHRQGYDADFSGADIYYRIPADFGTRFDTLSQEWRLAGKNGPLDWLTGVYLSSEKVTRRDSYVYGEDYEPYLSLLLSAGASPTRVASLTGLSAGSAYPIGGGARDIHRQTERNAALFANLDWALTSDVSAVLGLRFNRQTKTLNSAYSNTDGGVGCAAAQSRSATSLGTLCQSFSNPAFNRLDLRQKLSDDAVTGTFKLSWQTTPLVMSYASVARGWKGGGFNLDREQTSTFAADRDTSFRPETVTALEVGLKGRWWRGRLAFDAAAFHQQFHDFQLNTFLGATFLVTSVPELTSHGLEAETRLTLKNGLRLVSGVTWSESQFGSQPVPGLPRLTEARASFAPKWSATLQADYHREWQGLNWGAALDARYNSDYNTGSDLAPIKIQGAYTLMNGRLSVANRDETVALDLWGTNLTDETYYQVVFGAPLQSGTFNAFLGQPRTIGLTLRLRR
ncbi:TonB-dependent receptor [Asticcacaulis sp.]|uniref:TonB-dependent receptor n=1 Tax=Asticcacaulis sp. TaxID=1872648 RepID=UPI0031E2E07F